MDGIQAVRAGSNILSPKRRLQRSSISRRIRLISVSGLQGISSIIITSMIEPKSIRSNPARPWMPAMTKESIDYFVGILT
jgi:hypothetical protein